MYYIVCLGGSPQIDTVFTEDANESLITWGPCCAVIRLGVSCLLGTCKDLLH